ncbi:OsmC family protein [Roseiflexus sp. RS-1]|jgi:putative redox protein|uniref:OsmC family protein n=1 Tax=Roseiflexus sp. (strain RS-1) TaxID=357808 RepID=UPI0000D7FCDF|nr:OsmC family protein [Roseiflexus sp. RS-1]ABQ91184.1 OsmC family protein [Roseiflexus sp. RS-1]MBO9320706.1 OsmC family protein [Roseiflexus sp.]
MAHIELTWIPDRTFLGVDSTNHSIVLSPGGGVGVKPSETLLIALASCSAVDLVEILKKQRTTPHRLIITVDGEQDADPPWRYRRIALCYRVVATGATLEKVQRAVDLALNRYCSVRSSLHPEIDVTFAVELNQPDQE